MKTSGSGLPLASVSNGTAGGRLVPRRRTYCDAETAGMRKVIFRKVVPSTRGDRRPAVAPLPLNVLMTAAVVFLAAAGTAERSAVVPSACSQSVLRGHSPA